MIRPEITIRPPQTSRSGHWELSTGERDSTIYDDFWMMADYLAARYADDEADDDEGQGDEGQPAAAGRNPRGRLARPILTWLARFRRRCFSWPAPTTATCPRVHDSPKVERRPRPNPRRGRLACCGTARFAGAAGCSVPGPESAGWPGGASVAGAGFAGDGVAGAGAAEAVGLVVAEVLQRHPPRPAARAQCPPVRSLRPGHLVEQGRRAGHRRRHHHRRHTRRPARNPRPRPARPPRHRHRPPYRWGISAAPYYRLVATTIARDA
jgi:hypothetical protein